jgi:hypothetical protein
MGHVYNPFTPSFLPYTERIFMPITSAVNKKVLLAAAFLLFLVLFPTAWDVRATVFDYTKWGADSLGVMAGYLGLLIGLGLLAVSGGHFRRGLLWFAFGMLAMGSSFFFGPIINHYTLIDKDLVEGIHGIGMFVGMVGYLISMYYFMMIFDSAPMSRRQILYFVITFIIFVLLYIDHAFVTRTTGNTIKYWAELGSFGLSGIMVLMSVLPYRRIASGYRKAMNMMLFSSFVMVLCYPFGPIGQPTTLWTGAQGGTLHHGIMALSIFLFLLTVLYLRRLDVYASRSPNRM